MKNNKLSFVLFVVLLFFVAITLSGCVNLSILSQKLETTVVKTRNAAGDLEDDYAYKYTVQVRNKGVAGKVRAIGELYVPGAQYYRDEVTHMEDGEVKTFVFIFPEPDFIDSLLSEGKVKAQFRYEMVQ